MEVMLFGASLAVYTNPHRERQIQTAEMLGPLRKRMNKFEQIEVLIDAVRVFTLAALAGFYLVFVTSRNAKIREARAATTSEEASESTPLLANGNGTAEGQAEASTSGSSGTANAAPNGAIEHRVDSSAPTRDFANSGLPATSAPPTSYGSAPTGGKHRHTEGAPAGWERPDKTPSRSWWEYLRGYTVFFPYLWPSKNTRLQAVVVLCMIVVGLQRVVNVAVVFEIGTITNYLSGENGPITLPWGHILLYILYRIFARPEWLAWCYALSALGAYQPILLP